MPLIVRPTALAAVLLFSGVIAFAYQSAMAQIPEPPSTIAGSVNDSAGEIPEGLPVEGIVNDKVCGTGVTQYTGEGDARVTVYAVDVFSARQTPGCGSDGDAVRIRIGDRLSPETVEWEQGLVIYHISFGDATPAPIPTATPTVPATPTTTTDEEPATEATPAGGSPSADATSSGDGSSGAESPDSEGDGTATADESSTLEGGLTSSTPGVTGANADGGDDGGFPVWAILLLAIGGVAAVGGGIGFMMSRSGHNETTTADASD